MASEIESLETTSTSLSDVSLNISFEDINYTVRNGFLARGRKVILNNISGQFNAGELTVIIGQSGAGKSSLMDILSGYTKATSGEIRINGLIRNEKKFRRSSCYILQDNRVQDQLTIQESFDIAAELKLGDHIRGDQKKKRTDVIIRALGLDIHRHTRAGNLSGGQMKRLAIGLELISDPPIMFLDEPISGMDISTSNKIVDLLHLLARQGRTVVVTIHQPSAALLKMVDRVYAITNGKCTYMGSVPLLLPYLNQNNMICPPYHNPVDFLIEISSENEVVNRLVESSENGKTLHWTANITNETDLVVKSNLSNSNESFLGTLPAPKEDSTNKILLAIKSTYSTSRWKQFLTLTWRALLSLWRDPTFTLMVFGIHCGMALFVGTLFRNIGEDAVNVRDNYNFLFFSLMFLMFTAFSSVTITFPEQLPVVRREHFNRWYTTSAFFTSTLVSALPTQTVCTLAYSGIAYGMTGQPADPLRFFLFSTTLLAVSYVALFIGLLNGAMFNVKNGVVFGPLMIMPFTIFSGFFLRYQDAPYMIKWIFNLSFLKHGIVSLTLIMFGPDRPNLKCSKTFCYYKYLKKFRADVDVEDETFSLVVQSLLIISVVVITFSYVILRIRLKRKW